MKLMKSIITMAAAMAATIGYAGDSAPFRLDTMEGTRVARAEEVIAYSTEWDNAGKVIVAVDGVTLKEASAPASGDVAWNARNASAGNHTLTHTAYKNGVADKVESVTFTVKAIYTVTFNANGGSLGSNSPTRSITEGNAIGTLPTPTRTGYAFADWWTAANGGTQISASTTVSGNVTYYAHWAVNQYTVTFNANGGTGGKSGKQDYGSAIVAPTVMREGYTFTGWQPVVLETVPASNVTYTAHWTVNQYMVTFEGNGGALGEHALPSIAIEQDYGTKIVAPTATREGYSFTGWQPVVLETVPASNVTYTAQWQANHYTVRFNANGGEGKMDDQMMAYGEQTPLAASVFTKRYSRFAGWATEPGGEAVYLDCQSVQDLTTVAYGVVTLYAVWEDVEITLAECIDAANLALTNDESAAWIADRTTFKVDGVSLRSGAIAAAEEGERTFTTLTATVLGAGSGSFWWKVSCEEMDAEYDEWYDYAVFTIDGVEIAKIAGETDWEQVEFAVAGAGTHTLAWTFTRDDYDDDETSCENAAWVDGVVWTPRPVTVTFAAGGAAEGEAPEAVVKYQGYELVLPGAGTLANGAYQFVGWSDGAETYEAGATFVFPAADVTLTAVWELKVWTLAEAVDAAALSFTTGGDADWSVDAANGYTNGVSAKSGAVVNGQSSWVETAVSGAGTLVFRWNVMGGIYRNNPFAYAKAEVDGEEKAQEHKTDGWEEQTVEVAGAGAHTIRWTYLRTSARTAAGDCAWLDAVTWTPEESAAEGAVVEVNGAAVAFEAAEDGRTRTAAVAAGTKAEDVKVVVGGVDVTAGFKVTVKGTTATVALKEPYEVRRVEDDAPYRENEDGNTVTLNVEVVPGLYYAADSAASLEELRRPSAATPAKAGDALVAPKQGGAQGFYKVWVSDAPIAAE